MPGPKPPGETHSFFRSALKERDVWSVGLGRLDGLRPFD